MNIIVLLNVKPEDHENLTSILDHAISNGDTVVLTPEEIKKQKRSEYDKQRYLDKKNSNVKNVENDVESCEKCGNDVKNVEFHKEERDEEREGFSPSSPSSLPSSPSDSPINYPITPIIPSSQEKEAEREENVLPDVPKAKRDRGELKLYGWYVMLSDKEHQALVEKFGNEKTDRMIANMNSYIGEDNKRQRTYATRNHYLTLLNWERMDQERKQPKQIPKEKTFRDLRIEMEQKEEENTIDSFWRI